MNTKLFYNSIFELFASIIIAILVLYSIYRIFKTWLLKRYSMEEDSLTFNLILSGIVFSAGYLISAAIVPLNTTFKTLETLSLSQSVLIWECFKYTILYLILGFIITLVSSFITLIMFNAITRNVDELEQAAKGKTGYAILMAVLVVVIAFFVRDAYVNMLESMIPYPDLPFMPR